ncbi:hypothetical protein BH10ACT7_BH10ACT7_33070 [soil metagenome]
MLLHVLSVCVAAIASGAGGGFLLIAFFGVVGEEAYVDVWREGDWDAIARAGVGVSAAVLIAALAVGAFALGGSRLAFARQMARASVADPQTIAPWNDRRIFDLNDPFSALIPFGIIFLSIDALAVLVMSLALGETVRYNPDDAGTGGIVLAVALGVGLLVILGLVVVQGFSKPQWAEARDTVNRGWSGREYNAAVAAERARRVPTRPLPEDGLRRALPRLARIIGIAAGITGAVAAITFFIGLAARQPCRTCDQQSYGAGGETAIDVLMRVAGTLAMLGLLVLAVSLLMVWVGGVVRAVRLDRLARTPRSGIPQESELAAVLFGWWPGQIVGAALVGIGWGVYPIIAIADVVAPTAFPGWLATSLVGTGLIGLATLVWSNCAAARARNRIRVAWSPGDLEPPPAPAANAR